MRMPEHQWQCVAQDMTRHDCLTDIQVRTLGRISHADAIHSVLLPGRYILNIQFKSFI